MEWALAKPHLWHKCLLSKFAIRWLSWHLKYIIMTLWWWSGHHADHHGIMMIILAWHYDDHHGMAFAVHHTRKRWWVFLSLSLLWLSKLQNLSSQQNQIVIDMLSLCCLLIPKRSADTQYPLLPSSFLNAFSKLNLIVNCLSDLHQL